MVFFFCLFCVFSCWSAFFFFFRLLFGFSVQPHSYQILELPIYRFRLFARLCVFCFLPSYCIKISSLLRFLLFSFRACSRLAFVSSSEAFVFELSSDLSYSRLIVPVYIHTHSILSWARIIENSLPSPAPFCGFNFPYPSLHHPPSADNHIEAVAFSQRQTLRSTPTARPDLTLDTFVPTHAPQSDTCHRHRHPRPPRYCYITLQQRYFSYIPPPQVRSTTAPVDHYTQTKTHTHTQFTSHQPSS